MPLYKGFNGRIAKGANTSASQCSKVVVCIIQLIPCIRVKNTTYRSSHNDRAEQRAMPRTEGHGARCIFMSSTAVYWPRRRVAEEGESQQEQNDLHCRLRHNLFVTSQLRPANVLSAPVPYKRDMAAERQMLLSQTLPKAARCPARRLTHLTGL